jgi:hypothetical protein
MRHGNYGNPLPVSFLMIGNRSVETLRDIFGRQVAVVAEESLLDTLPRGPILEKWMRRLVLRREHECDVESSTSAGRRFDLKEREILDTQHSEGVTAADIA